MNKKDEVYDFLVNRLISAHYAFGERILVKQLSNEMQVSRQPIMAALNRLDADGFVRIVPQVGCQVRNPSRIEIADFFLMFQRFEGLFAELAATRRSDAQLRELKSIQQRIAAAERAEQVAPRDYADLNRSFHALIHTMANSPQLEDRQRVNFNMSDFLITHSIGFGRLRFETLHEHEAIIEAIERRAPDRARAVAEVHIGSVAHAVLSAADLAA